MLDSYVFGFNGQERQDEVTPLPYDFGNRLYDPRRGQFPTPDRFANKFPWQSSYVFAGNSPIQAIDKEGDAAWVVIKTTNGNKTQIQMKFDKDLIDIQGVYTIHRWVDPNNPSFVTSECSGTGNYSEYPKQFPNFAKGNYENFHPMDIIKSVSLEGEANIVFGEAAYEGVFAGEKLGGSVGFGGNLVGRKYSVDDKGYNKKWTSSFDDGNITLNPGISGGSGVGMGVRKQWNVTTGETEDADLELSTGVANIKKISIDGKTNSNGKIGLGIGGEVALGLGFKFDVGLNLDLTKFKKAIEPLGTKFTPYEKKMQDTPDNGKKSFNPNAY